MKNKIHQPSPDRSPSKLQSEKPSKTSNADFVLKQGYAGTKPAEIREQIASDEARGEGAMTAREAGHMRNRR